VLSNGFGYFDFERDAAFRGWAASSSIVTAWRSFCGTENGSEFKLAGAAAAPALAPGSVA
jgi:hypothetical protein